MNPVRATAQTMTGPIAERTPGDLPADGNRSAPARGTSVDANLHIAFVIRHLQGGGAEHSVLTLASALIARGHRIDLVLTSPKSRQLPVPTGVRLFLPRTGEAPHCPVRWNVIRDGQPVTPPSGGDSCNDIAEPDGGAVRNLLRLLRSLKPELWRVFAGYALFSPDLLRIAQAFARYAENERPDCIFTNLAHSHITCLLARPLVRQPPPVVPIIRGAITFEERRYLKRYPQLFPLATRIVAVSNAVAESVKDALPRVADRIATIYNPFDLNAIAKGAHAPPPHPWLEDGGPPVVLSVARLDLHQKDFPTLLRAFARVARMRPCRLLIFGGGGARRRLEAMARELRIAHCTAFPGWVENPWAAMARAAAFVLSSRFEGLPRVLIEALACGCPTISTDCPAGPFEILEGGRYGALVPVGDEVRLALAIARTLEQEERASPDERRQRREERKLRARMFRSEHAVERYLNLVAEVAPGKKIAPDGAS